MNQSFSISGGGVTGNLFRSINWISHALGSPNSWPIPLKVLLKTLFHSRQPMFIFWGSENYQFYNDAFSQSLGIEKQNSAMGQRAEDCWAEFWPALKPQLELVMNEAGSTCYENQKFQMFRNGKVEDIYWTSSYSPIFNENGSVGGAFVVCNETTAQILAQNELIESERRYREARNFLTLTLENAQAGTWHIDLRTNEVVASPGTAAICGVGDISDNVFKVIGERIHPDDHDEVNRIWQKCVQERTGYSHEYRIIRTDGAVRWVLSRGQVTEGADGSPAYFSGILADITEEVQARIQIEKARQELATERQKLEVIIDESPAGIGVFRGPTFIIEKVNSEWESLVSPRDHLGKEFLEAYPEMKATKIPKMMTEVFETGKTFSAQEMKLLIEVKAEIFEERYYDCSYVRILDGQGKPYGVFCHALNVTARVQTRMQLEAKESSLRLNEKRLSRALTISKVGFYDWDVQNDIGIFSDQLCSDWGIKSGITLHEAISRVHPDDRQRIVKLIKESLLTGDPYRNEYRIIRPDGSEIWVEVQGQVFYDGEGKPYNYVGTSIDVSQRKQFLKELELAKNEAESANHMKSVFLANMSHEIRTPLGVIIGFSEIAMQANQSEAERDGALNRILRNAKHLATIANDILDLAKVEADKFEPEIIEISTNTFFSDIVESASVKAREKGLRFISYLEDEVPLKIQTDPTRLKQILMNLIGNSIKFTSRGEVRLNFKQVFRNEKTYLKFEVSDTGIGLTKSQSERLFEPFSQADSSTTRKYGGTGLGLMLSRKLARSLGGEVSLVSSKLNSGSLFEVIVENTKLQNPELRSHLHLENFDTKEVSDLSGLKVLLVEDSIDNQELIGRYLTYAGAKVDFRVNGQEGVLAALKNDYDIVVMDVQMPVMEGYEAASLLRSKKYRKPIIALTAHAMRGEKEKSLEAGFSDYLTKPVDRKALLAAIHRLSSMH